MLGERLVMIRKNYKYSQLEFSQIINIKRPALSMYENNLRLPSLPLILGLDTKFPEINLHWLLSGEGNMFEKSQNEDSKTCFFISTATCFIQDYLKKKIEHNKDNNVKYHALMSAMISFDIKL